MFALRMALIGFFITSAAPYVAVAQTGAAPPSTIDGGTRSVEPNPAVKSDKDKSLSEKLKESEGVLKPPSAGDPEIRKPIPESTNSNMPVIIPPGEPGGDPTIQPK